MAKDASSRQTVRVSAEGTLPPPPCCTMDRNGRPQLIASGNNNNNNTGTLGGCGNYSTSPRIISTLPPKPGIDYHAEDAFAAIPFCESNCRWKHDEGYRSTWQGNAIQFIATLGYITGLHAICLFPVLCSLNGGLAFVIATFVLYLVLGGPLVLMEMVLGQLSKLSPTALYPRLCPLFSGIGFSMMVTSAMMSLVEACILSWSIVYMYKSADCELPWSLYENFTGAHGTSEIFPSDVVKESHIFTDFGNLQANAVISLAITWTIVMVTVSGGLNYIGKISCVTTPLMFFGAILMVARGAAVWSDIATEVAAPKWQRLSEPHTWLIAAAYLVYSLRIGSGGLTTIGSHRSNSLTQHPIRNTILLCGLHFLLSTMIWVAFESLMQNVTWKWEDSRYNSGAPWILFVLLAKGLSSAPHGIAIAIVFYAMVALSGLNTLLGSVLTLVTCLLDVLPRIKKFRRSIIIIVAILLFFIGIPLTSQAGLKGYYLLMQYAMCLPIIVHTVCIAMAISFGYGQKRFLTDLYNQSNNMIKHYSSSYLTVLLTSVIPIILMVLLVQRLCCLDATAHEIFSPPLWLRIIGWMIAAVPLVLLPVGAVCKLLQNSRRHNFKQSCHLMIHPEKDWMDERMECMQPMPLTRICHTPMPHNTEPCNNNNYAPSYSNRSIVHICDSSTVNL
ncbi:sodium- and chloride-dependent GABA transporter 1-like isoform X2 [Ischnura elegans]|uniref:sodium- and chloride-dependent GABA transporter 1-like isoform X2 n=1 Tax=Ischnura elegans TaxID=197161 RepID=UPI001ED86C4E|nr:sodium- and chloride-dependent GABA transporter 1-like isoform X2 [Ischnura elegans]